MTTPDEAVGLIAQTALESPATEFPLDALIAGLRDKETLLLLDNLEQVIEVAGPLAEFLASTTKVDLLATSREPLAIRAERRYVVAPLSTEDAVALFLDRASATAPDRAIEADESLVTLCRQLDGLPLALELAAARADMLPPKEMLQRHSEHLELLGSGPRDLPERQRSLRATLEWSYNLLGEGDRRLFARLGAFAGGAPLDAIEAVCGAELASLTPLADASLIRVSEGRVALLETIREYALEQLDRSDEAEAIRRRHIDYFLAFLTDSEHNLINAADPDLIEQVATEHPNILAALSYADPEQRLLITGAVWYFWLIRGYISEARGLIDEALRAGAAVAPEIRRKALRGGAILANRQSDLKVARRYAEEDLRIVQGIGDPEQIARSTSNLGTIATEEGKLDEARVLFERTLSLAREARLNEAILAAALNNLVEVACKTGDYNEGALLAQEAIETSRRIGDGHSLAVATINYGEALLRLGRHQEAIEAINESLEISRRLGDSEGIAYCLDMLGQLSGDLNDWVVAARLLGAASAVFDNLGIKGNALERALRDDAAVRARTGLGAEEFEEAWNDGRSLSLDAAIAEALELTAVLTLPLG